MGFFKGIVSFIGVASTVQTFANALAPSDTYRDADIGQSGYVGGDHNIDPNSVSQFKQLWNVTFKPDEKHYAKPLVYTLQSGRQIVFTASTENIIRSIDAATGEVIAERQVAPPWSMTGASCETVSKNMGIMGTPIIYPDYDVAFFFAKSYVEDFRVPGGAAPPMNSMYYLYAVYLDGLQDVYKFPIPTDDMPADNDARKIFLGGLLLQQPSLLHVGDVVYAGFGGLCDSFNYTGVVVAVNINTRWINRWVTQAGPSSLYSDDWTKWHGGGAGGIWQAGMGLSSDGQDVFFTIDNGGSPTDSNGTTTPIAGKTHQDVLSESVARIKLTDDGVQLVDFFRPYDYQHGEGQDLGSGGFSVLDPVFTTGEAKRIGVATSKNSKMYIHDLDNLGGYRQGANGSDGVLQTIQVDGEVIGGIGSYPLEGGYIYVNPGNAPLAAYRFTSASNSSSAGLFAIAGKSSAANPHSGVGIPTITSKNGDVGSGVVWITDPEKGLLAFKAVPVNGTLVKLTVPKVEGAEKYGRPVFGDGRVYIIDGKGKLVALGVK
ncbi:hypothetical protein K458DRAFT_357520 [Lentithecium fluviatile CBS 122367]|uniref:Uncharacterized protein n=1 Tax=Lentithecium fluviatile CBS 122367 TaxID=1168545 RepID=A0A6G1JFV3_9PLEO|nr:hypothetical protein K458DRAFT_357520 [Lentithecium fluviatile CBS 122367]